MKTDAEVALFLLDSWVTLVFLCFTEPIVQYCFVLFANSNWLANKHVPLSNLCVR